MNIETFVQIASLLCFFLYIERRITTLETKMEFIIKKLKKMENRND